MSIKIPRELWTLAISVALLLVATMQGVGIVKFPASYSILTIYTIGTIVWIIARFRNKREFHLPRFTIFFGILLILTALLVSKSPLLGPSIERFLGGILLLLAMMFVVDSLEGPWKALTWENGLLTVAIIVSVIGLTDVIEWYRTWWEISGNTFTQPPFQFRLPGSWLYHPNILAGFINIVLPITFVRILRSKDARIRAMWVACFFLLSINLYFTSSRGGWVGAVLGIGLTLILLFRISILRAWKTFSAERNRYLNWRIFVVAGIILLFWVILVGAFVRQLQHATHGPIATARTEIWSRAFDIILDSPLLGHGPGSFSVLIAQASQNPPGFYWAHAHNMWLQIGAETGVLGLLVVSIMVVTLAIAFLRAWKNAAEDNRSDLAAYAGVLVAVLSHNLVDHLFDSYLYSVSVIIVCVLILHLQPEKRKPKFPAEKITPMVGVILIIFISVSVFTLQGSRGYSEGVEHALSGDWNNARDKICNAAEINPNQSIYSYQCVLLNLKHVADGNSAESLQTTIDLQKAAMELDPYWPVHWANLATLEWIIGDEEAAVKHMEVAIDAAPRYALFHLNLGWMEEQLGHEANALEAYTIALKNDPFLARTIFFAKTDLRQSALLAEHFEESLAQPEQYSWLGWQSLSDDDPETARHNFGLSIQERAQNPSAYAGLALAAQMLGDDEGASRFIQIAFFSGSASTTNILSAARIARAQGLEEDAIILFMQAYEALKGPKVSSNYYTLVHRRATLPFDFMPQFMRANITQDLLDDFNWLADRLEERGWQDISVSVRDRIEVELNGP